MQEEKDHALGSQARVAAQQADSRRRKAAFPVGAAIFDLLALKTLRDRKECRCGHTELATVQAAEMQEYIGGAEYTVRADGIGIANY